MKGELDNVNSHVAAEDALKRRLARELKLGSAVPPVLDYVGNVVKLEKLRLKEKNESKRIQVSSGTSKTIAPSGGARACLQAPSCLMMRPFQFSIVHAENTMLIVHFLIFAARCPFPNSTSRCTAPANTQRP